MPRITKTLLSFLKEKQAYLLTYAIPVALISITTLVKFYVLAGFGHKIPFVLYFLVIVICGIYLGFRSAIIALATAIIFSSSIYLIPDVYRDNTSSSYSLVAAFIVSGLLVTLIATSRFRIVRINKEKEEQFQFLAEAVPEKIWAADKTGKANYYNQEWYESTGIKTFEELQSQLWMLIHPDDLESATIAHRKNMAAGTAYEIALRLKGHDGQYRWHLSRTKPKTDNQGNITMWIGTCIDIHNQKTAIINEANV
jgi:PAS domain S-box-containing protein